MSFPNHQTTTLLGNLNLGFLPSSAPTSSLLPVIPKQQQQQQQQQQVTTASQQYHAATALAALTQAVAASATAPNNHSNLLHQQLTALLAGKAAAQQQQQQQQQHANQLQLLVATTLAQNPVAQQLLPQLQPQPPPDWTMKQLKSQQPVPSATLIMLQDARKRADKRHAKRLANRKSAGSSRARKKAFVQEMTELNTRLRRQALILSLLPDLVIVLDLQGTITFCSAQVERVLRRSIEHDLIGADMETILVPESRKELQKLMNQLITGRHDTKSISKMEQKEIRQANKKRDIESSKNGKKIQDKEPASESSFPLSVVKVDPTASLLEETGEASDSSAKQPPPSSSLTTSSALENNSTGSDNENLTIDQKSTNNNTNDMPTSVESNKKLLSANANLGRNVRLWQSQNLMRHPHGYKDDVHGAAVTANNASARLSSLQHLGSSSEEDESGYRESNDSREETSSSEENDDSSTERVHCRTIAPTCNVRLIRNDGTTIWCEVTSSIRTRDMEMDEATSFSNTTRTDNQKRESSAAPSSSASSTMDESRTTTNEKIPSAGTKRSASTALAVTNNIDNNNNNNAALEILLCLRPIRGGGGKVNQKKESKNHPKEHRIVSEESSSNHTNSGGEENPGSEDIKGATTLTEDASNTAAAAANTTIKSFPRQSSSDKEEEDVSDDDHVAVESLMSMSKNP